MRQLITILFLIIAIQANGQTNLLGSTTRTDTNRVVGSLRVDSVVKFLHYVSSDTNKVLGVDANGFLVLRDKTASGGGSTYFAGYGLNLTGSTFKVDSGKVATLFAVYDTAQNIKAWVNGLFTQYYTASHIDSVISNYYTKSQSDARYLQSYTETDPTTPGQIADSLQRVDAALAGKIPYTDTATTVATEYERKRDSALAAANDALKLPLADTATVLANYNRALEKLGAVRGAKIYTCILRPTIDGSSNITWRFLGWSDDHDTLHAASVTVTGTYLQVNFDTTCKRVLVCIATPDDDMGAAGVTVGCKGNLDNLQIYGSAPRGTWDGYFMWTGGVFTPEYAISDMVFDSASVSPTYSFKITAPTPINPNYGNGLSYTSNYSGQQYAKWSVQYMGPHGYTISRTNDHFNPVFTVLDAAGNKVPNTAFTSSDLFMVKTGMDRRFPMSWDHDNNHFITSNSNIWVFAMMVTY